MNDPRVEGGEEWTSGTTEYREVVNRLNKAFVDTVRDCGGYNRKRWLLLPAYGSTRRETALKEMKLPWDFKLIVSVHAYIPYEFTLGETQYDSWDAAQEEDTKEIDGMMECIGWLTSFVSMYEVYFSICFVSGEHTVDVPDCAPQCKCSSFFVRLRVISQAFDHFIFLQFIHCKYNLSDNKFLLS